jgi:hypothetical protein
VLAKLLHQSIIKKNDLLEERYFTQPLQPNKVNKKVWSDWFKPNAP